MYTIVKLAVFEVHVHACTYYVYMYIDRLYTFIVLLAYNNPLK